MSSEKLERVAKAILETRYAHQRGRFATHPEQDLDLAKAAVAALLYEDGADEGVLVQIATEERIDAVSLALAWDAMLKAFLGIKPPERAEPTGAFRVIDGGKAH